MIPWFLPGDFSFVYLQQVICGGDDKISPHNDLDEN